jgi:hypothetical protein
MTTVPAPAITLTPVVDHAHTAVLARDWSCPVYNRITLANYITTAIADPNEIAYWVHLNGQPVGLFSFGFHPDHLAWETAIYLARTGRGQDLNRRLHYAAAVAFETLDLPLVASIHPDNIHSRTSFARYLHSPGELVYEPSYGRNAYLHHLTGHPAWAGLPDDLLVVEFLAHANVVTPSPATVNTSTATGAGMSTGSRKYKPSSAGGSTRSRFTGRPSANTTPAATGTGHTLPQALDLWYSEGIRPHVSANRKTGHQHELSMERTVQPHCLHR